MVGDQLGDPGPATDNMRWRDRSLGEVKRRTKLMGRFPGETTCLSLAWAVMCAVIAGGCGLGLTIADRHAITAPVAARAVPSTAQQVA